MHSTTSVTSKTNVTNTSAIGGIGGGKSQSMKKKTNLGSSLVIGSKMKVKSKSKSKSRSKSMSKSNSLKQQKQGGIGDKINSKESKKFKNQNSRICCLVVTVMAVLVLLGVGGWYAVEHFRSTDKTSNQTKSSSNSADESESFSDLSPNFEGRFRPDPGLSSGGHLDEAGFLRSETDWLQRTLSLDDPSLPCTDFYRFACERLIRQEKAQRTQEDSNHFKPTLSAEQALNRSYGQVLRRAMSWYHNNVPVTANLSLDPGAKASLAPIRSVTVHLVTHLLYEACRQEFPEKERTSKIFKKKLDEYECEHDIATHFPQVALFLYTQFLTYCNPTNINSDERRLAGCDESSDSNKDLPPNDGDDSESSKHQYYRWSTVALAQELTAKMLVEADQYRLPYQRALAPSIFRATVGYDQPLALLLDPVYVDRLYCLEHPEEEGPYQTRMPPNASARLRLLLLQLPSQMRVMMNPDRWDPNVRRTANYQELKDWLSDYKHLKVNNGAPAFRDPTIDTERFRADWDLKPAPYHVIHVDMRYLQWPLVFAHAPPYYNYGALGATLVGRLVRKDLTVWMIRNEVRSCLIDQFNREPHSDFFPIPRDSKRIIFDNNEYDQAGLPLAYQAFVRAMTSAGGEAKLREPLIRLAASSSGGHNQFNPEQMFFITYAQQLCSADDDDWLTRAMVKSNLVRFAPGWYRVNNSLCNAVGPEFGRAFNCKATDPMMAGCLKCPLWTFE